MHCNHILFGSALVILGGCATSTVIENPSLVKLEPMKKPTVIAGTRIHQIDKLTGAERYYEVININKDGTYNGVNQDGCQWSNIGDQVSPATSWNKCGNSSEWNSGENRNIRVSGSIWPLTVGNKASYSFNQINAYGDVKSKTSRRCKVNDQVNIETTLGSMDTYKVTCIRHKDTWSKTRVYYFSPDYEQAVKYVESSSSDGVEKDVELLRVESL